MDQRKMGGFTLIELMIAVVIIAVLAAISYPAYLNYTVNTRRAAATACLTEMAQFMERYYTTNMSYLNGEDFLPDTTCEGELAAFYTFEFAAEPTATAFVLNAVPQGQQATKDTKCATLSLNQTGAQTASGSASATPEVCW